MAKEKANGFDFIRDATRIVEQNEAMKGFFNERISNLYGNARKILEIIAKRQPISEFNLRSHTRMSKAERDNAVFQLLHDGIVSNVSGKLTVHPAFMDVIHE